MTPIFGDLRHIGDWLMLGVAGVVVLVVFALIYVAIIAITQGIMDLVEKIWVSLRNNPREYYLRKIQPTLLVIGLWLVCCGAIYLIYRDQAKKQADPPQIDWDSMGGGSK
jgi:hypothetical protein